MFGTLSKNTKRRIGSQETNDALKTLLSRNTRGWSPIFSLFTKCIPRALLTVVKTNLNLGLSISYTRKHLKIVKQWLLKAHFPHKRSWFSKYYCVCCLWLCASENQPLSECNKSINNSIVQTWDLVLTQNKETIIFKCKRRK